MEHHDCLDDGCHDHRGDVIVYGIVYAGGELLLFFHSGYFADQCIDIRGKIARKVSHRHLWERDSAVLYLCDSIYIDPILSLAVSAGQNARLASGILSFGNYCVFAYLLFRMAVRSKTL